MNWIKRNTVILAYGFIGIMVIFSSSNVKWGKDKWKSLICWDAKGYYAYLPAVFIYNDLSFQFYDSMDMKKYYNPDLEYNYRTISNGKTINKYYSGTAVAQLPFFLAAHILSGPLGYDSDGYSKIYVVFINLAAVFYLLLGLFYLYKLLILYGFQKNQISFVLLVLVFGTHLFYYTAFEPGMSHVYSFAFVNLFFYSARKFFLNPQKKDLLLMAFSIGLVVLIRPVNGLLIFSLPFLAGNRQNLKPALDFLWSVKWNYLPLAFLVSLSVMTIQPIIYQIQTGNFFVYSYTNEGFNFADPHMLDILFSYKKGLFLYTPILFLSLWGFGSFYKYEKAGSIGLAGFLIILTYVFSSWWNWWYGGSFSGRVYVEFLGVFALLLAFALSSINSKKAKTAFVVVLVVLSLFNQKQTYLYRNAFIHWENMTREKFVEALYHPVEELWTK